MHNNQDILPNIGGKTISLKKVMVHYTSTSRIRLGFIN